MSAEVSLAMDELVPSTSYGSRWVWSLLNGGGKPEPGKREALPRWVSTFWSAVWLPHPDRNLDRDYADVEQAAALARTLHADPERRAAFWALVLLHTESVRERDPDVFEPWLAPGAWEPLLEWLRDPGAAV